ncbi:hypothetical protein BKA69DRAFT_1081716 [Paraphysoderma sedebokerense]|nr:hypothetical protein BKA69DRAFT_1081716 [Paraphysoderma sedebokerense]
MDISNTSGKGMSSSPHSPSDSEHFSPNDDISTPLLPPATTPTPPPPYNTFTFHTLSSSIHPNSNGFAPLLQSDNSSTPGSPQPQVIIYTNTVGIGEGLSNAIVQHERKSNCLGCVGKKLCKLCVFCGCLIILTVLIALFSLKSMYKGTCENAAPILSSTSLLNMTAHPNMDSFGIQALGTVMGTVTYEVGNELSENLIQIRTDIKSSNPSLKSEIKLIEPTVENKWNLEIETSSRNSIWPSCVYVSIKVRVPSQFTLPISHSLELSSFNVNLYTVPSTLKTLSMSVADGNIFLKSKLSLPNGSLNVVNGNIDCSFEDVENLEVISVNGKVVVDEVRFNDDAVKEGRNVSFVGKSTNGIVKVNMPLPSFPVSFSLATVNGHTLLSVPSKPQSDIEFEVNRRAKKSGIIKPSNSRDKVPPVNAKIDLHTVNGNVELVL